MALPSTLKTRPKPVEAPPGGRSPPRPRRGPAGAQRRLPALQPVGRIHGHRAHRMLAEMALDLQNQGRLPSARNLHRIVDLGQLAGRELTIDHRALNLEHPTLRSL